MNFLMALLLLALPASVFAQQEESLRALDQKCEEARSAALAPVRARLARECELTRTRAADPHQECAIEMSTYGNNSTGARGAVIRGLFYDLPECIEAKQAWLEWERNRPWK